MSAPLAEAVDLTRAMLSAAKAGDWPRFGRLHDRRAQLLQSGIYVPSHAPMSSNAAALNASSELLRPISNDSASATSVRQARGNAP